MTSEALAKSRIHFHEQLREQLLQQIKWIEIQLQKDRDYLEKREQ